MNWYKFNHAEYAERSRNISDADDLTYRRMIDMYYLIEGPLPLKLSTISDVVRMDEELVEFILAAFFEQESDGYHDYDIDEAISKRQSQIDNNRELGARSRGVPKPRRVKH